jgi:hypothetical protein
LSGMRTRALCAILPLVTAASPARACRGRPNRITIQLLATTRHSGWQSKDSVSLRASVLAARTRSYRAAVYNAPFRGLSSIEEWATLAKTSSASMELEYEMERLRIEYEYWLAVPGGRAYLAWLTALVATAEMGWRTRSERAAAVVGRRARVRRRSKAQGAVHLQSPSGSCGLSRYVLAFALSCDA